MTHTHGLERTIHVKKLSDMEILKSKINMQSSILNQKDKEQLYTFIHNNRDVFSIRDEIGTCPQIQVHLKLCDKSPFFIHPYPIREEQKQVVKREVDRLV